MEKLCCFLCKEEDLPSIDVNITCPSNCCVENKITRALSRKFSHYGESVGEEAGSDILQRTPPSKLRLNRQVEQGKRGRKGQGETVDEKTADVHITSTS